MPSLLARRRTNESLANPLIELFEIAKIYLPEPGPLPEEWWMLGITSGRPYAEVKGVVEAIVAAIGPNPARGTYPPKMPTCRCWTPTPPAG